MVSYGPIIIYKGVFFNFGTVLTKHKNVESSTA